MSKNSKKTNPDEEIYPILFKEGLVSLFEANKVFIDWLEETFYYLDYVYVVDLIKEIWNSDLEDKQKYTAHIFVFSLFGSVLQEWFDGVCRIFEVEYKDDKEYLRVQKNYDLKFVEKYFELS